MNLADASCNLINKNGPENADNADIDEAEMLARKAVRIIKELKGPVDDEMSHAFPSLLSVLFIKGDFTDQTNNLLEDYLSNAVRYEGVDAESNGHDLHHLGHFNYLISEIVSCNDEKRN
jgi:hypothetical protein